MKKDLPDKREGRRVYGVSKEKIKTLNKDIITILRAKAKLSLY